MNDSRETPEIVIEGTLADSNRMTGGGVATSSRVPLSLDQIEATCDWFDHKQDDDDEDERYQRDVIDRARQEEEMTQQELQEATDDWHDTHN